MALSESNEWFLREVHQHDRQLKSWLRGKYPGMRDVEDVVQDSYLKIWRFRLRQPVMRSKALLFRVASSLAVDLLRRCARSKIETVENLESLTVTSEDPSPFEVLDHSEKIRLIAEALLELPPRCREVFRLSRFEGFSQKEIAAKLNISESTVENQLTKGTRIFAEYARNEGLEKLLSA